MQRVGVKYLSGEKPKSTSLAMKWFGIELCLVAAGKISLWMVTHFFLMVQKATLRQHFCFGCRRGALGSPLLLKPCSDPTGGMQVNQPVGPTWALVSWNLALMCLYFYMLCFWAGGIAFQYEIKPWQPSVKHGFTRGWVHGLLCGLEEQVFFHGNGALCLYRNSLCLYNSYKYLLKRQFNDPNVHLVSYLA